MHHADYQAEELLQPRQACQGTPLRKALDFVKFRATGKVDISGNDGV